MGLERSCWNGEGREGAKMFGFVRGVVVWLILVLGYFVQRFAGGSASSEFRRGRGCRWIDSRWSLL
jgi:hypothetical protein